MLSICHILCILHLMVYIDVLLCIDQLVYQKYEHILQIYEENIV